MTALSEYQRLECTGLWRAAPEGQRREVIVHLADAADALLDNGDALEAANRGARTALIGLAGALELTTKAVLDLLPPRDEIRRAS